MPADVSLTVWSAAKQGDVKALQECLTRAPQTLHQRADDGCTLLHYAAFSGSHESVALLLKLGSDSNAQALAGHTPLHYAAFAAHEDVFRHLVTAGSNMHAVDDSQSTMLHAAASGGNAAIVDLLLSEGLLADTSNLYGELPVHRAAQRNRLVLVQRLLDLGCDSHPIDRYGMTLLHKAAIGDAVETTHWLLDHGYDPAAVDVVGDTPTHSAASMGRLAVLECLLDRGAPLDPRNHEHVTPLHHAATAGHFDVAELLLNHGADASATDVQGRTPLHMAAIRGHTDIVAKLTSYGQSKAISDIRGHRPVELAALYGRSRTWELLASDSSDSKPGHTPSQVKALADKAVPRGEMLVWYLGHSGWCVRTQHHLFILDYAPGEPEGAEASLVNGRIDPAEWGDVPVIVLATHHHGDHFDVRIRQWEHPQLRRIYGWDTPNEWAGFRFTGQEFKRIGNVIVASIPATDAGSAFLIEADGVSFYHAGDHAASQIPVEPEFSEGIDWLADQFAPIQAAFLPVFGCGLPSPDTLQAGSAYTIERLNPDAAFPMHIGWTSTFYRQFGKWIQASGLEIGVGIADQPGDRFRVRRGAVEQIWA